MRHQWVNLSLLAFGLVYSYFATGLSPGTITDPGPGFFPRILGAGMLATALAVIGIGAWNAMRASGRTAGAVRLPGRSALLFMAGLIGYLIALPVAGYPLATFLALAYLVWLMGESRRGVILGLAAGLSAAFFLIFWYLQVPLPRGIFG